MREIELEHLSGPLAGRKSRFPADRLRITVGSDEHSDVAYPREATLVAAEHLELVRDAGYYELRTNTQDVVCVNGRAGLDGQELEDADLVELGGPGGPQFRIRYVGETAAKGAAAHRSPDDAVLLRRARRTQAVLIALVVLVAIGFGAFFWRTEAARQRLDASIAVLSAQFKDRQQPLAFDAAIAATAPSVYLVLIKSDKLGETAVGTAWAAGEHVLATNAHIAWTFAQAREQKKRFIVRATTPPYADIDVVDVRIHPGFLEFALAWEEYSPRVFDDDGREEALSNPGAYDVALLQVAPGAQLARPLRIASDATLAALAAGDPIAYVGFPMENLVQLDVAAPNPVSQVSSLIGLASFTLIKPVDGSGQLLEHSLPGAGGASGSPIINPAGEVIGLFSAGNVVKSLPGNQRMLNAAQVNFGQRVDVLNTLLREPVVIDLQALRAQWAHDLERYKSRRRATEIIVGNALDKWSSRYGENLTPNTLRTASVAIDGNTTIADQPATSLTFDATPGHYFVAAVSPAYRNIDAAATRGNTGTVATLAIDTSDEHYPMLSFDIDKPEPISIFIIDKTFKPTQSQPTSTADVTIYHLPTPPPQDKSTLEQWFEELKR